MRDFLKSQIFIHICEHQHPPMHIFNQHTECSEKFGNSKSKGEHHNQHLLENLFGRILKKLNKIDCLGNDFRIINHLCQWKFLKRKFS